MLPTDLQWNKILVIFVWQSYDGRLFELNQYNLSKYHMDWLQVCSYTSNTYTKKSKGVVHIDWKGCLGSLLQLDSIYWYRWEQLCAHCIGINQKGKKIISNHISIGFSFTSVLMFFRRIRYKHTLLCKRHWLASILHLYWCLHRCILKAEKTNAFFQKNSLKSLIFSSALIGQLLLCSVGDVTSMKEGLFFFAIFVKKTLKP